MGSIMMTIGQGESIMTRGQGEISMSTSVQEKYHEGKYHEDNWPGGVL